MKTIEKVRFTFLDKLIKEPVIHKVGRDFNVVTNIRRADMQDGIGWVILAINRHRRIDANFGKILMVKLLRIAS